MLTAAIDGLVARYGLEGPPRRGGGQRGAPSRVLATLQAWDDPIFCKQRLGLDAPLDAIDRTRLNVTGSSLAAGHPFAATGVRPWLPRRQGIRLRRHLRLRGGRPRGHGDTGEVAAA